MTVYAYYGSVNGNPFYIDGGTPCLITSIVLPDQRSYQFVYETSPSNPGDTTGRLAAITLPGGGVISYQYTGGYLGSDFSGDAAGDAMGTAQLMRMTSDGSTTYSRTVSICDPYVRPCSGYEAVQTTVQDPQGNQTNISFEMDDNFNLLETSRSGNNGQPSVTHAYYMAFPSGGTNGPPWQTMPGQPPLGTFEIDVATSGVGETKTIYNPISLVSEVDEYDWGYGPNSCCVQSVPSRKTFTTYASLGNNILDRSSEVCVTDGNGNTLQDTTYGYDEGSLSQAPAKPT